MELFKAAGPKLPDKRDLAPLADRIRPERMADFVGQEHLLGPGRFLRSMIEKDQLQSLIFWGPPGTGKTTLASIIARSTRSFFLSFSAVLSGVKEIRQVIQEAEEQRARGRRTILFVDEIHRFNKAQQDAFLPHVERGTIILIGATTENPSFEVNSALLSRCKVLTLRSLTAEEIDDILTRALRDEEKGLGKWKAELAPEARRFLREMAQGDARVALNALEAAVLTTSPNAEGVRVLTLPIVEEAMQRKALLYDKGGEEHYNVISAFHKSLRGSDPDAALYWLARMIEAGEDPLYVARRMVRFAGEDIGLADPQALHVALMSMEAFHFVGLPEGELALAEAAVYLATAPKSNAIYVAYGKAKQDVAEKGALPVPLHIRNAPTRLMKELGYGRGYKYAHDYPGGIVEQDYLPAELGIRYYYHPTERGFERIIHQRLQEWRNKDKPEIIKKK
ncbi:MAG TPA: replication-associated recombination protein A [Thermodesulfobacteriota bacterium]|nr:replication-associated recombination protein A [Thermodesulfobacteriota bacterium]